MAVPKDGEWILRNLTTKEFVTAAGIAQHEGNIGGPFDRIWPCRCGASVLVFG